MDLASVVAALASVGVRVSGSTPNNNIQGDSSRACPTGLAGPEPSGTLNDPGQHFLHAAGSMDQESHQGGSQEGQVQPHGQDDAPQGVSYERGGLDKEERGPDVKRHSLRNALLITITGDRQKTAMWRLDECDVSGQTIRLQAIPAQMSCDEILEWVGEEVLKEYRNLHHTGGLRPGDRDVNYVSEGSGGEAAMDPGGADGDEALDDDDDDDEPAEVAVCAFVANNLNTGSNRGSWKPLQKGWRKKEKKDPRRIGNPALSFAEFVRAHPQGCFVCYGRNKGFNHDHRTCPIHKADTEAYKKVHGSKKRAPAGIRETKVEVTKDELSKLMSVGTELAKEIQEIKRTGSPSRTTRTRTRTRRVRKGERRRVSTRLMRRRVPLLPQPTPLSGAPAAKGPS